MRHFITISILCGEDGSLTSVAQRLVRKVEHLAVAQINKDLAFGSFIDLLRGMSSQSLASIRAAFTFRMLKEIQITDRLIVELG